MTRIAAHINDAGITLLAGDRIAYREPGFALLEDSQLRAGHQAFAQSRINPRGVQHRFWSELETKPLADRRFSHLSAADLVSRQLEQMWKTAGADGNELVVAVPAYMSSESLGLLLGIAGEIELPVVALVEAAVAATRREYRGAVPVHIDVGLHSTTLTRMLQDGRAQVERSEVLESCGVIALYDAWLHCIAEAFVQQSRFDPLHTADTEQMLLDRLTGWLEEAATRDRVHIAIEHGQTSYEADIESLQLIGAAAPVYQLIESRLRPLFRAEETPALQVTDRVARLPGLTEMLKARVGGEVFALEPGATARGALARCREPQDASSGVALLRQLPWDQPAVEMGQHVSDVASGGVPTHLLFGSTAWSIGNSELVLGSEEGQAGRAIKLSSEMPGVSRRHCSLKREKGQCVIEDHSRYGTFLNGHRINGSSVLQIGDSLRIGSPGFEFALITTDEQHG